VNTIPLLDTWPDTESLWDEIMAAVEGVIRSGKFIMGPEVKAFEEQMAAYLGVKHAIGCNSGTDALVMAVRALGIGPGDEVITTPFSFIATSECVDHVGAKVVFVDIDPETFNLDIEQVAKAVTPKTKAIIPVHLYGHACDMDSLMELGKAKGIRIIEDVAQAFGSQYNGRKVASIGDAGCLSFFPSKNLGAFGDGGMVVTNDDAVAEMVRTLRVHGARKKYFNEVQGYNSRLDTLQAAILAVKLPHIDEANEGRRRVAKRYNEGLAGVAGVQTPVEAPYTKHVYHQYTIRVKNGRRDEVQAKLKEAGVQTFVYYPVPLHRLPLYDLPEGSFPKAEQAASEALSLPIWPKLDEATQDRVIAAIRTALGG